MSKAPQKAQQKAQKKAQADARCRACLQAEIDIERLEQELETTRQRLAEATQASAAGDEHA